MSGDQRKKMAAGIKKSSEDAKVACRNIRRDANKHFEPAEKNKEMTEDERDAGQGEVQNLLKRFEAQDRRDRRTRNRRRSWSDNPRLVSLYSEITMNLVPVLLLRVFMQPS